MKDSILFINPQILFRDELFGGIVGMDFQMFILGKREYSFLKSIKKYCYYNSLNRDNKKIAKTFLDKKILLRIDVKKGESIINKSKI